MSKNWTDLPTDYEDAKWEGQRRYNVVNHSDGTISLTDVTEYIQEEKSFFGAEDANQMNAEMNEIVKELGDTDISDIGDSITSAIKENDNRIKSVDNKTTINLDDAAHWNSELALTINPDISFPKIINDIEFNIDENNIITIKIPEDYVPGSDPSIDITDFFIWNNMESERFFKDGDYFFYYTLRANADVYKDLGLIVQIGYKGLEGTAYFVNSESENIRYKPIEDKIFKYSINNFQPVLTNREIIKTIGIKLETFSPGKTYKLILSNLKVASNSGIPPKIKSLSNLSLNNIAKLDIGISKEGYVGYSINEKDIIPFSNAAIIASLFGNTSTSTSSFTAPSVLLEDFYYNDDYVDLTGQELAAFKIKKSGMVRCIYTAAGRSTKNATAYGAAVQIWVNNEAVTHEMSPQADITGFGVHFNVSEGDVISVRTKTSNASHPGGFTATFFFQNYNDDEIIIMGEEIKNYG